MTPSYKRILAASFCLAGLAGSAGLTAGSPVALTASSMVSNGEQGQRLNLPAKSPLILPRLNGQGPLLWLPVTDALVYAGCTVVWRSSARLLQINAPSGAKARLVLGEPYLFEALTRTALSQAPVLLGGTPALPAGDLRLVLEHLVNVAPAWEAASPSELAGVFSLYRGTLPVEPALVPTVEPQLVPSPGPNDSHVAAKVLTGGKLKTVVIDAGHGGRDSGALGHGGLREKDTCLDMALRTQAELKRLAPDLHVILTRKSDEYLTLRERTDVANKQDADLFVSIHNNASTNRKGKGTQVFFYDTATSDRAAADLVARENEDVNELEVLLTDIAKSLVRDQSIGLASRVQNDLGRTLNLSHRELSYAPFYVLARTKMPAILIEVAFITHREEERLLADEGWRQKVAASVARGVLAYRKQVEQKP